MRISDLMIAAVVAVTPGAAFASDVTCVWRALPEEVRTHTLNLSAAKDAATAIKSIETKVLGEAMIKCFTFPSSERKADEMAGNIAIALFGHVAASSAQMTLGENQKIESYALERGYNAMPPASRRALVTAYQKDKDLSDRDSKQLDFAIYTAFPEIEKITDQEDKIYGQFVAYFIGRAIREQYEAKF